MTEQLQAFWLDPRQILKVVVYTLLLVNFGIYFADDLHFASVTMRDGGALLDWTAAFATTIDMAAWLTLLFLFELETYLLSDENLERAWVTRVLHGIRLVCYVSLAHSVYAFAIIYFDLTQVGPVPDVTDLCALVAPDISFVRNLEYTDLTTANCATLSNASQFYFAEPYLVLTDSSGLALETNLALIDFLEVIVWLLILLTIEVMVRLQDRGVTRGKLVTLIKGSKLIFYAALWLAAAYWFSLGHYHYAWDEALWILGFAAIEMNMREWKKEIEHEGKQGEGSFAAPG